MTQTSTSTDPQTDRRTGTALLDPPAADEPQEDGRASRTRSPTPVQPGPARPESEDSVSPMGDDAGDGTGTGTEADSGRHDSAYAHILAEMDDDRRNLRSALVVALLFHLGLFFVHLPELVRPMEINPAAKQKAYVIQQVRFQPPRAAPQREIPDKKAKKIPVPDPTPHDPEPVRELTEDLPELDYDLPIGELKLEIPEGPPGPSIGPILQVGGGIDRPIPLYNPKPGYTEEARQARIQGVVLLQLVIDREGNVREASIIKGLPLGLGEKAVETVKEWKYQPAVRENGEPVAVYLNLTINFSLQ